MKGMIAGTLFQQPCTAAVVCLVHCAVACGVHAQHLSFAAQGAGVVVSTQCAVVRMAQAPAL